MNTVVVGDRFENRCFELIKDAIKKGKLGLDESLIKIFQKKGYYSNDREKEIIFDLSIEVWPKDAERYVLLFLIECKSYSTKGVPVDDVEEFYAKINQVAGANLKGIMISETSFQEGGLNFAKNKGMMLIEVNPENTYSIILHRTRKSDKREKLTLLEENITDFLYKVLGYNKVKGLKKMSKNDIENYTNSIIIDFNQNKSPLAISEFQNFLNDKYKLKFDFSKNLRTKSDNKLEGYFDVENNTIYIDQSITNNPEFPFIFGHEVGHFFLHKDLQFDQNIYNNFQDARFDYFSNKYKFTNDKHWIEWQANYFSVSLLLPKKLVKKELLSFRRKLEIPNPQRIYLDNQAINQQDFIKTINHLSNYFGISKTAVKYRLEELDIITYDEGNKDIGEILRDILSKMDN